MGLGFGLLSAQRTPDDPRTWEDRYAETLELTRLAEDLGYDSVWTTEHHFVDDGYMPSLLVTMAAMASVTSRISIGSGVILAPLHHPLRLAEDAATVQLLSHGRLILGLGLGWSGIEFEAFGADLRKRGRAMEEILDILPRAWTGEPFTHEGDLYRFPTVGVRPAPTTPPPIVIGGSADAAVRRAARKAQGFFSNAAPKRMVEQIAVARDELERAGKDPAEFQWWYYRPMYPCDDPEQGWREVRDALWAQRWKYADMEASASRSGPIPAPPPLDPEREAKLRADALLGPGDEIVTALHELRDRTGVPLRFVARSYFPPFSPQQQREVMERLAAEVLPHV